MQYHLSYKSPHQHLIDIQFTVTDVSSDELLVQLPAWRPGRYELANFAQNIKTFLPKDSAGKKLKFEKVTKDCWKIHTKGVKEIHINYSYYANEINAGSTFLDESQLYVNGVNCLLYVPDRMEEPCELKLQLPKNYQVATGLNKLGAHLFSAASYHDLVDCPFIASPTLNKSHYTVQRTIFTLWFQGEIQPDWKKLLAEFKKFTEAQLKIFSSFPFKEYHFLFQALPGKHYHGVEHGNSTVIALGPSYTLMSGDDYEELLGISSHELFHSWNVKAIRPIEMMPYDYSCENYSRLGYVAEGVTTYYGDLMLLRAGVFTEQQYLKTFNDLLARHFNNFGRLNLSVADSSFDTWIDGYKQGVPGRKSSIYTEGALCAFMLDIIIRRHTNNSHSLDAVMRLLYTEFGKKKTGYSESDYKKAAEKVAEVPLDLFFEKFIGGTAPYIHELINSLDYIGYELSAHNSASFIESKLGFKVQATGDKSVVTAIYPGSPADKSGLTLQDEIIGVNGMRVQSDINEWCCHFSAQKKLNLTVATMKRLKEITISPDGKEHFLNYAVTRHAEVTNEQLENYRFWAEV